MWLTLLKYVCTRIFHFLVYPNESTADSAQWLWDTVVTDIRSTCPANRLAATMNNNDGYDVYRLIIETRPSTPLNLGLLSGNLAFHGWDSVALFGYKIAAKCKKGELISNIRITKLC